MCSESESRRGDACGSAEASAHCNGDSRTASASAKEDNQSDQMWIYGFGSLMYRPGFDFQKKVFGYIRGWRLVFWQGSTDHRGKPGAPGRVATIVPAGQESTVWGTAYQLAGSREEQKSTMKELEHREKQYDLRLRIPVYVREGDTEKVAVPSALVFIATDDEANPNWLGSAAPDAIAEQIAHAAGPSGANCDYVYRLAAAMRELGAANEEMDWLADKVRSIRRSAGLREEPSADDAPVDPD